MGLDLPSDVAGENASRGDAIGHNQGAADSNDCAADSCGNHRIFGVTIAFRCNVGCRRQEGIVILSFGALDDSIRRKLIFISVHRLIQNLNGWPYPIGR
ncbi:MAG: hypothetical protein ACYS9H_09630 [Planctomycetota bacterium]